MSGGVQGGAGCCRQHSAGAEQKPEHITCSSKLTKTSCFSGQVSMDNDMTCLSNTAMISQLNFELLRKIGSFNDNRPEMLC